MSYLSSIQQTHHTQQKQQTLATKRCTKDFSLSKKSSGTSGWSSSTLTIPTESDLLKFEDLNMDLKEILELLKNLEKQKKTRNNNVSKARAKRSKKNTSANINSKARNIEAEFNKTETEFAKKIIKILSEKIKAKVLFRLDRLINNPHDSRLNKVACALRALFEILQSCSLTGNSKIKNEAELIDEYRKKVEKEYPDGTNAAAEYIKDILETNKQGITDFISKEKIHNGTLGTKLKAIVNDLPTCSS